MANFNITISNQLNVFGPEPSTKWGVTGVYTMVWGVSKWGESTNTSVLYVQKLLSQSLDVLQETIKKAAHVISQTIDVASDVDQESLTSGDWYYVFTRPTTDPEEQVITSYSSPSDPTTSYSSLSASSTSWSSIS